MIVLDVCAAIEIASGTPDGKALENSICEGETVIVPNYFYIELSNTLYKCIRGKLFTADQATRMLSFVKTIVTAEVDVKEMLPEIISESLQLKHPTYDIGYFVLARRNGATLLTVDKRLAEICEENRVSAVHFVDL